MAALQAVGPARIPSPNICPQINHLLMGLLRDVASFGVAAGRSAARRAPRMGSGRVTEFMAIAHKHDII